MVVEPGVVLDVLNAELAPLGRRVEPVPVNARDRHGRGDDQRRRGRVRGRCRFGSMGDQVEQLRVVFAQGETADLGFQAWPAYDDEPASFTDLVVRKLHNVYRQSQKRLAQLMPPVPRNRAGYALSRAAERRRDQPGSAGQRLGGDAGPGSSGGVADGARSRGARGRGAAVRKAG